MIFLIERTDYVDYEEDRAVIVREADEAGALEAVRGRGFHPGNCKITRVPSAGPVEIILIDNVGA